MKRILATVMIVLILLIMAGHGAGSDGSDDSSSDSSSNDSSSDSSSDDSSSGSGSDDSSSGSGSDDSSSDSGSDDSSSGSGSDDSSDDSSSDSTGDRYADSSSDSSSSVGSLDDRSDDSSDDRYADSRSRPDGRDDTLSDEGSAGPGEDGSGGDLSIEVERIRESASEREREREAELARFSGGALPRQEEEKDLRVALFTLQEAGSLPGAGSAAPQLVSIAEEIQRVADESLLQEERIHDRSRLVRFFAGGDREAAAVLERDAGRIQARILNLEGILASGEIDGAFEPFVRDTLQELVKERDHLVETARIEREDRGLFGGILGS